MRPKQFTPLSVLVDQAQRLAEGRAWEGDLHKKVKAFWYAAMARCNRPTHPNYKNYGARGIKCLFRSPEEVIAAIGLPPTSRHSVDRIDGNGNYEAGNVRWATQQEQTWNLRTNAFVVIDGKRYKRVDLVREYGVTADRIDYGAKAGWPFAKIVSKELQYDTSSLPKARAAAAVARSLKTGGDCAVYFW